jgi:ABC-type phosphate transport system substrate-binding protein
MEKQITFISAPTSPNLLRLLPGMFLIALAVIGVSVKAQESSESNPDSLVVVVSTQNAIDHLDKKQLIDIFMGRFKNFPNGASVTPIDYFAGSSQRKAFYELLVGKSERKINAYWSRLLFSGRATPPEKASSIPDIIQMMREDVNILAYLNASKVTKEMKIVYRFE